MPNVYPSEHDKSGSQSSSQLDYALEVAADREGYGDPEVFAQQDPKRFSEITSSILAKSGVEIVKPEE